jgi:hypothetical protein
VTWEECLMKGMSASEAAHIRGTSMAAASQWAKRHGRVWTKKETKNKRYYGHLANLTVSEAAKVAGVTPAAISFWSQRNYVIFANTRWYDRDAI